MKFNSQIATSRSQSERLLALGLKKETADMYISNGVICARPYSEVMDFMKGLPMEEIIPAWSLHRLLELQLNSTDTKFQIRFTQLDIKDAYDFCVGHTEWLIKEGYFNKEYLV